jgi:glycosyltransferase involved in cell wall biosynthesis
VRKVLVLTYHFPPSAASGTFRLLGFVRHLPRFGWQSVVVAPSRIPWEPVDEQLLQQIPTGTPVCSVPYPQARLLKGVRWLMPNAVWLPRAWRACVRMVRTYQPDALLSSSPPHCVHLLGLYLKRRFGLPWVVDFRDPWFIHGKPGFGNPLWPWFEAQCEKVVMRHADVVVANAPAAAAGMAEAFPQHGHKMITLSNGFDPESFPTSVARSGDRAITMARSGDRATTWEPAAMTIEILHTGEVYARRDARPLLDALQQLHREPLAGGKPYRLYFLGRSKENGLDLSAEIRRRGLEQLVDPGCQVPYGQVLQQLVRAEILLLLDSPGRRMGIPAKLYEYLGAGRPILALAEEDGDVAWALRTSGILHRIAPPRDAPRIKQALVELTVALAAQPNGVPAPERLAVFTRERIAQDLAERLDACVAGGPNGGNQFGRPERS